MPAKAFHDELQENQCAFQHGCRCRAKSLGDHPRKRKWTCRQRGYQRNQYFKRAFQFGKDDQKSRFGRIEEGHVYVAMPPLYGVKEKDGMKYLYSDDELNAYRKQANAKLEIQRYKGLGEMDADQLWDTTMDPKKRTLIKVGIEDAALCEHKISILMGNNAQSRRKWIDENIDFTLEEDYKVVR